MAMDSLVDGIDHVYIPMSDARAAFEVLTEELLLPVMWPYTSFGDFSSGGVSVGSIKLEVIEANATAPWCRAQRPAQIQGIAFRPAATVDDAYLAGLDARSIPRSAPEQYPQWTNVYFHDLVSELAGAFVCDYHVPGPKDLELRRRVLTDCGGGRLGVQDAVELVVATADLDAAADRWQRLLDPLVAVEPLLWRPSVGPGLRLVPGAQDRVQHLVVAVRSAGVAQQAWRQVADGPLHDFPLRFVER